MTKFCNIKTWPTPIRTPNVLQGFPYFAMPWLFFALYILRFICALHPTVSSYVSVGSSLSVAHLRCPFLSAVVSRVFRALRTSSFTLKLTFALKVRPRSTLKVLLNGTPNLAYTRLWAIPKADPSVPLRSSGFAVSSRLHFLPSYPAVCPIGCSPPVNIPQRKSKGVFMLQVNLFLRSICR